MLQPDLLRKLIGLIMQEFLLRIRRADALALGGFSLFKHPKCDAGSGCGLAAVESRRHGDSGTEFAVGKPDTASVFSPVSSTDLATASHRHSQTDQALLPFTQQPCAVRLPDVIRY